MAAAGIEPTTSTPLVVEAHQRLLTLNGFEAERPALDTNDGFGNYVLESWQPLKLQ